MNQQFDVVVIGGGVVGLTAALAMAQQGFSTAVVDAGPLETNSEKPDSRVYAINQASQDLLQQLGAWPQLDKTRLSPYQRMYVWDATNGAHIEFDARMIAAQQLGTIVEESVLKQALLQEITQQTGITLFPKSEVTAVEQQADSITVSEASQSWQAKLLMIADGGNSPCRQLLKVPLTSWSYHHQAIVASVSTEKKHQKTAYQVFNADGPLAFLPLIDEQQCSIVWSTTPHAAKRLMALNDEEFSQALTKAFANKLGQVNVQGKRHQFPLIMRHAKQYTGKRWLLLGDAAHTIHPLAGLGLNVGLADVAAWLACLTDKGKGTLTSPRALGAYQRQRKYAVWQVIAMMDSLKTLFTSPFTTMIALRGLGLRISNHCPPLKRLFIAHAVGKPLDY
ncbi:FAD-dependent oxidoreductase [Legionella tunisiensis]|uniref:FAD-dependent oxidoreductase n=1 Tax=Legionella tunisiensis TaxID=1034944 RepID=UPI0002FC5E5A|nr:FAD-dependent oxidoreductase [Legionella tunisiensis]